MDADRKENKKENVMMAQCVCMVLLNIHFDHMQFAMVILSLSLLIVSVQAVARACTPTLLTQQLQWWI